MLVTLGLLTHNHEKFVRPALEGILRQTYTPLQILITDDASSDRTPQIIGEVLDRYAGPHQVQFNMNAHNQGLAVNINRHMTLTNGELYVIASGDDVSYPNRVERLVAAFAASGCETMSLYSNANIVDEYGKVQRVYYQRDPLSWRCLQPADAHKFHKVWVLGASHAWNRRVFEIFGPLPAGVDLEDWVIPFRSGLIGKIVYVNEVLVDYRVHGSNMSFVDIWSGSHRWYADKLIQVEKYITTLQCIDKDIALARLVLPEKRAVIVSLEETNRQALTELMEARELLQNRVSVRRKVRMAGKYFRGDGGLKKGIVWLLTYFCPSLYLKYIQFRARLLTRKS
jgi:glycosyltransferase involved in cell wall biosynthesis